MLVGVPVVPAKFVLPEQFEHSVQRSLLPLSDRLMGMLERLRSKLVGQVCTLSSHIRDGGIVPGCSLLGNWYRCYARLWDESRRTSSFASTKGTFTKCSLKNQVCSSLVRKISLTAKSLVPSSPSSKRAELGFEPRG